MNVFEDLIIELKEENLLEKTVIDVDSQRSDALQDLHKTVIPDEAAILEPQTALSAKTTPLKMSFAQEYGRTIALAEEHNDELEVTQTPEKIELANPKKRRHDRQFFQKR